MGDKDTGRQGPLRRSGGQGLLLTGPFRVNHHIKEEKMAFPHQSIREAMSDFEKEGELIRISEEVDWNLEVGAITRRAMETGRG